MMTSRQRVEAALAHRSPDRTPIFEYVLLSPLADTLLGRPCAANGDHWPKVVAEVGWEGAVRQIAVDRVDLAMLLGHDMMYVSPNSPPPQDSVAQEAAPAGPAAEIDDPVERLRLRNEQAALVDPPSDDTFFIYPCLIEEMARRDLDLPILAPAYSHGVWTDVDLMQTMLLEPDVASRHFALATQRAMWKIEKYLSVGVSQIGIGGDISGTRPLISPQAYRRFIVPEVQTLARRVHAGGAYAVNASDGNLWPLLEDFLFGCEVDGYLEVDKHAGMEMSRLKPICRGRVTIYGNIDCGNVLSFASPQEVRRQVIACLEEGMGDGGHIFCASNAITASVPLDNYLALVRAYQDVFGIERLCRDGVVQLG